METIFKALAAGGKVDGNTIYGAGAVMGNLDRYNDVLLPGSFKGVTKSFLKHGFMPLGHNWYDLLKTICMPTDAYEKGPELQVEGEFHSTENAKEAKIIIEERLDKGLSIGLSIGFTCAKDGVAIFEEGAGLLDWLEKADYDMSLFDVSAIKKARWVRAISKIAELFEVSIVTVPANSRALAHGLKFFGGDQAPDGLTFADHSETVLRAVREFVTRAKEISSMRHGKGSDLSEIRRDELRQLKGLLDDLERLSDPSDLSDLSERALKARIEAARIDAAMLTLPTTGAKHV